MSKNTKIIIYFLQQNTDNKKCLLKVYKQADIEILRLHYLKFQIPTA